MRDNAIQRNETTKEISAAEHDFQETLSSENTQIKLLLEAYVFSWSSTLPRSYAKTNLI